MRHRIKKIKLSRSHDHRRALQKNLLRSFLRFGRIETTRPRALITQRLAERVVARGRKGDVSSRRYLYRFLQDQKWTNHLVDNVFSQFKERNGGFTRLRKARVRRGDGSLIYRLEFVKDVSLKPVKNDKKTGRDDKNKKIGVNKKAKEK